MSFRDKARERAARVKSLGIATVRANAGEARDIADIFVDAYIGGASIQGAWDASQDAMLAKALARYQPKITAALARAGIDVDASKPFTMQTLIDVIEERSGLNLANLDLDSILGATDHLISAQLSRSIGVPIATMADTADVKAKIDAAIITALRNGKLEPLLTRGASRALRAAATWKRYGLFDRGAQRKARQIVYQRRYAKTHKQVWS